MAATRIHLAQCHNGRIRNHAESRARLEGPPVETHLRSVSTRGDARRPTLGAVIRQFKSRSTTRIWAAGHRDFGWQSRYHDHIIRGDRALAAIREYIANNPAKWALDEENPAKLAITYV
ncbi:MAG: transposase [Vicinamibacterales bacterium]